MAVGEGVAVAAAVAVAVAVAPATVALAGGADGVAGLPVQAAASTTANKAAKGRTARLYKCVVMRCMMVDRPLP